MTGTCDLLKLMIKDEEEGIKSWDKLKEKVIADGDEALVDYIEYAKAQEQEHKEMLEAMHDSMC